MADNSMNAMFDALDRNLILDFSLLLDDNNAPTLDILDPPRSQPVFTNQSSNGIGDVNNNECGRNQFTGENSGVNYGPPLDIIGRPIEEQVFDHETSATRFCNDSNESGQSHFVGESSGVNHGPPLDIIGLSISEPNFNQDFNGPQSFNDFNQSGENQFRGETSGTSNIPPETGEFTGFGNPMDVPVYPVPPLPYSCTCCQVLREITHTNGDHFTKLELHGRLGLISHAILESRYAGLFNDPTPPRYQMFDFCKKSLEAVREMLTQYCEDRKKADYVMLQDPLRTYYEALCVGLNNEDYDDFLNDFGDAFETSPLDSSSPVVDDFQIIQTQSVANDSQVIQTPAVNQVGPETVLVRPPKRSLGKQRQRTKNLTLRDFAGCHHLPIEEAAKAMNVCTTVLKAICRRHGVSRWPYRRIKSLQRRIAEKKKILSACSEEGKKHVEAELQPLEAELAVILATFYHS